LQFVKNQTKTKQGEISPITDLLTCLHDARLNSDQSFSTTGKSQADTKKRTYLPSSGGRFVFLILDVLYLW